MGVGARQRARVWARCAPLLVRPAPLAAVSREERASSESASSAKASSIASSIISSFMPMTSFCFSNSIMIFWICGMFIFAFILFITLET